MPKIDPDRGGKSNCPHFSRQIQGSVERPRNSSRWLARRDYRKPTPKPVLPQDFRHYLIAEFSDDIGLIEELLGRDLCHWRMKDPIAPPGVRGLVANTRDHRSDSQGTAAAHPS